MNDLLQYFESNKRRLIHKWTHYFEIYERHFSRYRGTDVCIVEIGVSHGGSLQMWRDYFGTNAKIIGVDIDPRCKDLEEEGIEIVIGSQEDREFLRSLKEKIPRIDILIDDGGHTMAQQIVTFEELFSHIDQNGVYLCEDLHTSYWADYGGGFRQPSSFIEYSKNLIDSLNAWHSREPEKFLVNLFTRFAYSMTFYDSVLVIEKRAMIPPQVQMTGHSSFAEDGVIQDLQVEQRLHYGNSQSTFAESSVECFKPLAENETLQNYVYCVQKALEQTHQELAELKTQLQDSKTELEQYRVLSASELNQAHNQIRESRFQLVQVESQLLRVQRKRDAQHLRIQQLRQKLQQVREKLQQMKINLNNTRKQLEYSQNVVEAMQSSRFWRLREQWFQFKRLFLRQ
jgi:uncharacterized protein YqgV (UPF0045/DUF77 family)